MKSVSAFHQVSRCGADTSAPTLNNRPDVDIFIFNLMIPDCFCENKKMKISTLPLLIWGSQNKKPRIVIFWWCCSSIGTEYIPSVIVSIEQKYPQLNLICMNFENGLIQRSYFELTGFGVTSHHFPGIAANLLDFSPFISGARRMWMISKCYPHDTVWLMGH